MEIGTKNASVKIPVQTAFPTFPYAEYLKFKLIEDEFLSQRICMFKILIEKLNRPLQRL